MSNGGRVWSRNPCGFGPHIAVNLQVGFPWLHRWLHSSGPHALRWRHNVKIGLLSLRCVAVFVEVCIAPRLARAQQPLDRILRQSAVHGNPAGLCSALLAPCLNGLLKGLPGRLAKYGREQHQNEPRRSSSVQCTPNQRTDKKVWAHDQHKVVVDHGLPPGGMPLPEVVNERRAGPSCEAGLRCSRGLFHAEAKDQHEQGHVEAPTTNASTKR
mmetsp:Transcript_33665/g.92967  ORF Transcript_33665/g.92967 Transcript_33665/m.92967 type:complete len:213 (-) Transcript_33665:455-1093(-)